MWGFFGTVDWKALGSETLKIIAGIDIFVKCGKIISKIINVPAHLTVQGFSLYPIFKHI